MVWRKGFERIKKPSVNHEYSSLENEIRFNNFMEIKGNIQMIGPVLDTIKYSVNIGAIGVWEFIKFEKGFQ